MIFSGKRNIILPDNARKFISQRYVSMYFFWKRSYFIYRLKNKIIFSGKRTVIFSDNARKIIFQCNCFRKTILLEHLQKVNMFSSAVLFLSFFFKKIFILFRGFSLQHFYNFFITFCIYFLYIEEKEILFSSVKDNNFFVYFLTFFFILIFLNFFSEYI